MAAKMKLCRCLSKAFFNFSVLWLLTVFSQISRVQLATQPPNVTTTDAATTTEAATTTTTTLPPTTTTIAPNEPRTVIGDTAIGQCLCDLTGNECDVNCFCDEDCTDLDKEVFIRDPANVTIDNRRCYQEQVFLFSNSPATTKTENGLFCIYFDNYEKRNYYLDPDFILDIPTFNSYVDRYGTPTVQGPLTIEEPVFDLNSFYKKGDIVYIIYQNEARGTFVLPDRSVSNECNDQNTIGYWEETKTECVRIVSTLDANTCTNTGGFSAASYYQDFRVVKTSGLFGYVVNGTFVGISTTTAVPPTTTPAVITTPAPASNTTDNSTTVAATTTTTSTTTPAPTTTAAPTTVDPALIQTLYNNPYTLDINETALTHLCVQGDGSLADCTFTNVPTPTFTSGTCNNVVQEVRYFVTTDGTNGIAQMLVQFVFRNINATDLPLAQSFSVKYNSISDSNNTFERSGNPGYLIGKPLLYGTLNVSTSADNVETQEIILATEPSLGLTVVRASANGVCAPSDSRIPVLFGEDLRTGCLIRLSQSDISATNCQNIQRRIVETLEGPNVPSLNDVGTAWVENNRYVGTFGNTDRLKVGDWVKVIASDRPLPSSAEAVGQDTCRLRMGLHIQVLYANVGALANPQAKIIGVALLYDRVQEVKLRCAGSLCLSDTQAFEVSQTVSFIDVSEPATGFAGESPVFLPKVPDDFFYPFLYYSSGSSTQNIVQLTVPVILIAVISLLINVKQLLS